MDGESTTEAPKEKGFEGHAQKARGTKLDRGKKREGIQGRTEEATSPKKDKPSFAGQKQIRGGGNQLYALDPQRKRIHTPGVSRMGGEKGLEKTQRNSRSKGGYSWAGGCQIGGEKKFGKKLEEVGESQRA